MKGGGTERQRDRETDRQAETKRRGERHRWINDKSGISNSVKRKEEEVERWRRKGN